MLGIFVIINQLYEIVPKEYSGGILVVLWLEFLSIWFDSGNNNAIIFNTKYYRAVLFLGVFF
jgi:hypothetical protein